MADSLSDNTFACVASLRHCPPSPDFVSTFAGLRIVLKLKVPWRNGATHIVLTPMEFMQRLAALVPRPRLHLIRFHGVLAPHAKLRSQVVPAPAQQSTAGEGDCQHALSAPLRMTWARLLKRVFDIEIEQCACGGKIKSNIY